MELRHIRAFIAIAEERSFTRAAARLGMAQPALSVQMRQLEEEAGGPLFRRLAHGVELSQSGAALLSKVADMPSTAERGLEAARRVAHGEAGTFTLGFTASSIFNNAVAETIATFRRSYPDVELRLEEANTRYLLPRLRKGVLDAAFLRPALVDGDELTIARLPPERLVAVLPRDHVATGAGSIALSDLAAEPLLLFPREVGPHLYDIVVDACRRAGFEPKLGQTTPQIASIVHLVAARVGVAIVPQSMSQLLPSTVAFVTLADPDLEAPLAFAWGKFGNLPAIANITSIVRAVFSLPPSG